MELSVQNVQITFWWDNEDAVWPEVQAVRDEFNRHRRKARENFMKLCRYDSKIIDNDDCGTEIGRQMRK